ncbi:HPt (histidine-containing phosphotransfer) domain-containing protein [Mucilaginibacter lappiensis]|uniref:HPt (Histidine-containing phosphotransfer) domain-containing protein n=1 Tax=Mucilaginibacter lappiensis TaxID=354630 RepID=A0ABR6PMM5_9SPHI|nr:Hpt domain-containing protein [Mucilaginibacter lappiensis]MBB6111012.1 HPt (histidine-containing phosphotransfer) domain-containing protein [Mucilaginibacter lappiensis]SIR67207.1 HPt (histidine-containing phosphotransfer) domain-containing protein [Mucilaginibacter lappiensis]
MADISPDQDLDLSFLYEIADGSTEFVVESIAMFLQQTPELFDDIDRALADKDWAAAGQAAHKLKPNLGFFGMPISQEIIQEVEIACKEGALNAEITRKFNQVKTLVNANLITLQQIKAEKEGEL